TLATLSLSASGRELSHNRDLPPLKLAAADLDSILLKAQSLIAAANGPSSEQDSARESVKLGVHGKEVEIPHFSLASSVAFPRELFRFCYTYYRPNKPISSVTLDSATTRAECRSPAKPRIRSRQYPKYLRRIFFTI